MNLILNRKFRIKLESFDTKLLNTACEQIENTLKTSETKIVGPIYLPTRKEFTVYYDQHMLIKMHVNTLKLESIKD